MEEKMEEKNKGGRPTLYKPEFCQKVDSYIQKSLKGVETEIPTIEGFAIFLGVSSSVVYDWERKYPEFLDALDAIRDIQKKELINKGLKSEYNSTITKLMLSANHGMHEKSGTEFSGGVEIKDKDQRVKDIMDFIAREAKRDQECSQK